MCVLKLYRIAVNNITFIYMYVHVLGELHLHSTLLTQVYTQAHIYMYMMNQGLA